MNDYYQCTKCKELKPPSCFAKNKSTVHRDGLNCWCKICISKAQHKQSAPEEHTIINPFIFQDGGHELRAEDLGATNVALRLIPLADTDKTASILLLKETGAAELKSWLEKAIT